MAKVALQTPVSEDQVRKLEVRDIVYITGVIYTSRDMGHLRVKQALGDNEPLPVDFEGSVVFHAGPVVKEENGDWKLIVIGPTTSTRMEPYAEMVGQLGVRALIGKAGMGSGSSQAFERYGGIYLQAPPGCAVKLGQGVERIEEVHWLELGIPEALWVLKVKDFGPLVVAMDSKGRSLYRDLKKQAKARIRAMFE